MKWIKRVSTPLTVVAKVIDSLSTNLNTRTNAPSIRAVQEMKENLEAQIENADSQIEVILNRLYPVGAIYISTNDTSPSTILGGAWQKIEDRFLLASSSTYAKGSTGGEATHTLTKNEMPNHAHDYYRPANVTDAHALTVREMPKHEHRVEIDGGDDEMRVTLGTGTVVPFCNPSRRIGYTSEGQGDGQGHTHTISDESWITVDVGGGAAHNNMPPYLAVNMWVRIS